MALPARYWPKPRHWLYDALDSINSRLTHLENGQAEALGLLHSINNTVHIINRKQDTIMTDISGLQSAATTIQATVAQTLTDEQSAITALNDLSKKIGSGGTVSQSDVDAVTATLTSSNDSLASAHQTLTDAIAADDPTPPTP